VNSSTTSHFLALLTERELNADAVPYAWASRVLARDYHGAPIAVQAGYWEYHQIQKLTNTLMNKPAKELSPHPLNAEIYGDSTDEGLIQSIRENGVLQPVLIDFKNRIISGHRRFEAAVRAGLKSVPVEIFSSRDELDIAAALVEANRHRVKSNEQIAREAAHLLRVEKERARNRQGQANSKKKVPAKSPEDVGDARAVAARKLGLGAKKIDQAAAVVATIDRLKKSGDEAAAEKVREQLNKYSVNRAFKVAHESGFLNGAESEPPVTKQDFILIQDWTTMSNAQQEHAFSNGYVAGQFTTQTADGIEWARHSWNPITGCRRQCKYCYARDMAARLFAQGFEPSFYPGRLKSPEITKLPKEAEQDVSYRNVFTCSMADLFGPWVPTSLIELVLNAARSAPRWNFLFLTKFPERLCEVEFPSNAWVGTTIDSQDKVEPAEKAFERVKATVKWVSCEPLLERITFSKPELFDWIVLGGSSKSTQTPEFRPPREWIEHLWKQADSGGCKLYEKPNLLSRRREYPVPNAKAEITFTKGPDKAK
jgi:protein gp37/ParB-like chromosome segregation protein Spo0J